MTSPSKRAMRLERHVELALGSTDLPNRLLLMQWLTQAIGMASRNRKQIALLFLDLGHFKRINDAFGREERVQGFVSAIA